MLVRVCSGTVRGSLPRSDDRPLYWARLQVTAALRQWRPRGGVTAAEREQIIETFEKASRGMTDISSPAGPRVARVLASGFDPYTLDGGDAGEDQPEAPVPAPDAGEVVGAAPDDVHQRPDLEHERGDRQDAEQPVVEEQGDVQGGAHAGQSRRSARPGSLPVRGGV